MCGCDDQAVAGEDIRGAWVPEESIACPEREGSIGSPSEGMRPGRLSTERTGMPGSWFGAEGLYGSEFQRFVGTCEQAS